MNSSTSDNGGDAPSIPSSFLATPSGETSLEKARVVILPVPYDGTSSYKSGAREGPAAIVDASRQLEDYDLELDCDPSAVGIYTMPEIEPHMGSPEAMIHRIRSVVEPLARSGKIVGVLGGEHTVAIGSIQAYARAFQDLSVLYLDAHADMREEYMGTRWGHASVARRASELCSVALVGIRSLSKAERDFIGLQGIPAAYWPTSAEEACTLALEALSQKVYISLDLDVLDPSIMAAVGNPEPGGMAWREILEILRAVGEHRDIVGFDVTELNPREGPEASAFTAAKLTYKLIAYATSPGQGARLGSTAGLNQLEGIERI